MNVPSVILGPNLGNDCYRFRFSAFIIFSRKTFLPCLIFNPKVEGSVEFYVIHKIYFTYRLVQSNLGEFVIYQTEGVLPYLLPGYSLFKDNFSNQSRILMGIPYRFLFFYFPKFRAINHEKTCVFFLFFVLEGGGVLFSDNPPKKQGFAPQC